MGRLIVLEGLDGAGKGTQTRLLAERLRNAGRKVRLLDFPMYHTPGAQLAELYLSGGLGGKPEDTGAYAASMFFAADRYVNYRTDWKRDADDPNTLLLANRYTTANAYHQLSKLPTAEWESYLDWLWDFEYNKLGMPAPDRVLFLEIPLVLNAKNVQKRSKQTGVERDIHEKDATYLWRCREAALYVAMRMGWKIISCADEENHMESVEVIGAKIEKALKDIL